MLQPIDLTDETKPLSEALFAQLLSGLHPLSPLVGDGPVAELLGIEPGTLRHWRSQGRGPRFVRQGRSVMYRPVDLLTYLEAQTQDPRDRAGVPSP